MKHSYLKHILLCLFLIASTSAFAVEVELGGLWYNVVTKAKQAELIQYKDTPYSGNIVIPATVEYNGVTCSVTSIGDGAFSRCSGLTSVTIPGSVTSIGSAFYECSSLTSVHITDLSAWCSISFGDNPLNYAHHLYLNGEKITNLVIPNNVTSISDHAFSGCTDLTSVIISNSVTGIGSSAFFNCSGLTSITIGNGVTSIGDRAFYGCNSLTSVNIPNGVTSIAKRTFFECSNLTSVTIPSSVTSIGGGAFYGCSSLIAITIPEGVQCIEDCDTEWSSGYVKNVYGAFGGCSALASVTIPGSVTSIGRFAFSDCSSLTSIHIPNSVISIGGGAFYNCSSLSFITIQEGVQCIENAVSDWRGKYRYGVFEGCSALTSVSIPNSVTSIGDKAFYGCIGLTSVLIGNSATTIGWCAFYGCNSLTSVTIPNSVTSIGSEAFYGCNSLTSINIPNSVTSIATSTFYGCSSLTSITIPNSVTSIDDSAFYGCTNLSSVTIGCSVTYIDSHAFAKCDELADVYCYAGKVPGGRYTDLFEDSYIEYATLHVPAVSIDNYKATEPWSGFGTIVALEGPLPEDMVDGLWYRFDKDNLNAEVCQYKNSEYSGDIVIPETIEYYGATYSVTSIGKSAFSRCSGLESVTIGNAVNTIGEQAFYVCSSLTSVTIGNGVTSIGKEAFRSCDRLIAVHISDLYAWCKIVYDDVYGNPLCHAHHLYLDEKEIKDLVVPSGVKDISDFAFSGCSGLTSITIPESVTYIGQYAFSGCSGVTDVYCYAEKIPSTSGYAFGNTSTYATKATLHVPVISMDKYKTEAPWSDFGTIVAIEGTLPEVAKVGDLWYRFDRENHTVKVIRYGNNEYSGDIVIPTSIEYNGVTCNVTSIDNRTFFRCNGLISVTIGNAVNTIGEESFCECSGLTSISFGDNVTSIGNSAFYGCSGLTSITVPNSVTSIGVYAFANCNNLASVHITDLSAWCKIVYDNSYSNPLYYAHHLYLNDEEITNLVIPEDVTSIGKSAFSQCEGLETVTIHKDVTSIGQEAFYYCKNLVDVYCYAENVPECGTNTFYSYPRNATLHVPGTAIDSYKTTEPWSNSFKAIVADVKIDGLWYTFYDNAYPYHATVIPSQAEAYSGDIVIPSYVTYNNKSYSVTAIGNSAFSGCSNVTSVTIPNKVTTIGKSAFYGCDNLLDVYCYAVNVPECGTNAFPSTSPSQTTLHVPEASIDSYKATEPWSSSFKDIVDIMPKAKADGLWYAFDTVTKQATVIKSRDDAYSGNIVIPVTVQYMGETYEVTDIGDAFSGCSGLTAVTIPNSVEYLDRFPFSGCYNLTSVTLDSDAIASRIYPGSRSSFIYTFGEQVKEYIVGNSVTSIGNGFSYCSKMTDITIGKNVTYISSSAFRGCSGLTAVHITDLVAWCNISFGDQPLSYAHHLYMDGQEITDLVIPEEVTTISDYAFNSCEGLTSVTIPSGVTSVGGSVFAYCSGLTSIKVNEGNSIYDSRNNCNAIIETATNTLIAGCKNTVIPNSVTSIGGYAFSGCSALTSVTIPNSVTSIGNYAFYYCSNLNDVYCLAENVPETGNYMFSNSPIDSATLYVPEESVDAYSTTSPWSEFGTIVGLTQDMIDGIQEIRDDSLTPALSKGEGVWFTLDGRKLDKPQKGINIIRYPDGTSKKVMMK